MKYSFILTDLDNTLFDFNAGEEKSLPLVFEKFGYEFNSEKALIYKRENSALWHRYENGEITMDEVLNNRFRLTMEHFGEKADGHEWDVYYRGLLCECCELMPGAREFCEEISKSTGVKMYVVTNGVEKTQLSRLTRAGMLGFFDGVFTSQKIGVRKPEAEFFSYVSDHITGFDKNRALIIGDSPETDIKGGTNFGIDSCLVTWGNADVKSSLATYTVSNLEQAKKFVLNNRCS